VASESIVPECELPLYIYNNNNENNNNNNKNNLRCETKIDANLNNEDEATS